MQFGIFPVAVLIENSFAFAKFSFRIVTAGCQRGSIISGILDVQIPKVLEVGKVGSFDRSRSFGPAAVVVGLIVQSRIGKMAGETPAGAGVHIRRRERVKTKLRSTAVDVFHDCLQ